MEVAVESESSYMWSFLLICYSLKKWVYVPLLLFGIIKRPLYVVNSKAEKKMLLSQIKKKKRACKARVLF